MRLQRARHPAPPAPPSACRLCCLCGTQIAPNPTNMCVNCIRSQVDITEGIQKQVNILWCKSCGRYLQPPKHWLMAQPESKELLTFCIKRIKGMQKVRGVLKWWSACAGGLAPAASQNVRPPTRRAASRGLTAHRAAPIPRHTCKHTCKHTCCVPIPRGR